jgi:hypothetical protein
MWLCGCVVLWTSSRAEVVDFLYYHERERDGPSIMIWETRQANRHLGFGITILFAKLCALFAITDQCQIRTSAAH